MWENRTDISAGLVHEFDAASSDQGANNEGVKLIDERMRQGKADYFERWKGRLRSENSCKKLTNNTAGVKN